MRAENKTCRRFCLAALSAGFLFAVTKITSVTVRHRPYVAFEYDSVNMPCTTADVSGSGPKGSLRLLVSYVFFETDLMSACEVSNKRNNLATFLLSAVSTSPPDVHFVFTFPGRKPDYSDVLHSTGLPPGSDSGKAITKLLSNSSKNVELISASVNHPAPDLCHHHAAINEKRRRGHAFDYVLVLNDGVRGPFFDANVLTEMV